jgi:hypothetical protein
MTTRSNTTAGGGRESERTRIAVFIYAAGKIILGAVLLVLLYLLGQSMMRHRFFQGGRINRNYTLTQ